MSSLTFRTVAELENLGEASLQTGPFGTQLKASEYVDEGIPVINVRNIGFGDVRKEDLEYVNEAKAEKLHQHRLRKGDIVFGRKGAVERHALIDENVDGWIQGSDCLRLRIKSRDVCERYLSHYLKTQAHQDWMQALCSFGATMTSLNQDIVRRISFPAPPIEEQKKIAATLTTYDELIENNQRRIALLEKMAEEIYREWFIRLRFPGHEQVKVIKGVPEGWRPSCLGSVAKFTMGQSPSSEFYNEVGNGLPFHQGVGTYGERFPRTVTYCSEDGRRAHKGDILFSVRAPVGRLNIADREMIIGRGLSAIRHKKEHNHYLYYLLKTAFVNEDIIGNGSIFNSVGKDELAKFPVFEPEPGLVEKFDAMVSNIDKQITMLMQATECLKSSRDALLPRLISGKLSVENLDIQFPPGMAETANAA
jgi:type I restriction enzyme S subunit